MRKIMSILLVLVVALSTCLPVFAADARPTHYDEYLVESIIQPFGANPPSSTQIFDLDRNSYSGYIQSFGTRIFTNTNFITTSDSIYACVSGDNLKDYLKSSITTRSVALYLYKAGGKLVGSTTVYASMNSTRSSISKTFDISGEPAGTKYYVCVQKSYDDFSLEDLDLEVS